MEIKKEKSFTEIENEEIPQKIQDIFDKKSNKKITSNFRKSKDNLLKIGLLVASILLIIAYNSLPVSKVKSISVEGNRYLNDNYIIEKSTVSNASNYYLTIPFIIQSKLNEIPLIESSTVSLDSNNHISINVVEKKAVGYRYEDEPYVLFSDNTKTLLESEYLDIIAYVPIITGFSDEEQTRKLTTAFKNVDVSIIEDISEIKQYDLGYDSQGICVLMRNGGYFIANYRSLPMINKYYDIYNYLKDKNQCIYADDSQETAYAKACPWNETIVEHEYWLDENGEPIKNAYGDKAVIHYYKTPEGEFAVDNNGNKIKIPLNKQGFEEEDENFYENYLNGYYATGVLQVP